MTSSHINSRQELLERRSARHLRRQQLARRRTAASQERMKIITQLAAAKSKSKKDDDFGRNDDDWDVYKVIRKVLEHGTISTEPFLARCLSIISRELHAPVRNFVCRCWSLKLDLRSAQFVTAREPAPFQQWLCFCHWT